MPGGRINEGILMKALSIRQPWAWLICAGYKDIENRDWKIGRNPQHGPYKSERADFGLTLPTRIYIHAGAKVDWEAFEDSARYHATYHTFSEWVRERLPVSATKRWVNEGMIQVIPNGLGAIIGEAEISACVDGSSSRWFTGKYGFLLANPKLYIKPTPYPGRLGFFEVPDGVVDHATA